MQNINKQLPVLMTPLVLSKYLKNINFNKQFRILDANFGKNSQEDYKKGHIKNALYFDTLEGAETSKIYPRNLPKIELFKDYVSNLGISNKHHLIVYDRTQYGFNVSSRVWWIFRLYGHENVSILNGGLNIWLKNNLELCTEIPTFPKEDFKVKENKALVRNYNDIVENIKTKKEQVIDARSREDFNIINPILNLPNKIPNSINVPYSELFDAEAGTIKDKAKLSELFNKQGVDLSKPLISSCNTSVTGSSLALAAYLLGAEKTPVYKGSWTEYSQKKEQEAPGRIIE